MGLLSTKCEKQVNIFVTSHYKTNKRGFY